ncbi:4-hydroxyproline epimerase [Algicola sagamiensis]|uniref:4-hydroxyproline epimerase n=1 Tax=Algicola sagamiensis TaxID=163869 RepID=UPI00037C6C5D|nr:4-hydroxyproline epimerase [Algicola sagamiensis]
MREGTFFCIDAHTCGNPLRLVTGGYPALKGETMSEKRQDFIKNHDWIRHALMFEPRGHAMMSGAILYPPHREDSDASILFIETSGCLPMCGHGTIGCVTAALEHGHLKPRTPGHLKLDVPAGQIQIEYQQEGEKIRKVRIFNVASYLAHENVVIHCPTLGELTIDIAYGGNFYAIIDPQKNYSGLEHFTASQLIMMSPTIRELANEAVSCIHPDDPTVHSVSHVLWAGKPQTQGADAKNAVFYGEYAIDRSPCGTGTSARMAQLAAKGKLSPGETFVHESIIGSLFEGRVESTTRVGEKTAIMPSIQGWAKVIGINTIFVDSDDPFAHGFEVR